MRWVRCSTSSTSSSGGGSKISKPSAIAREEEVSPPSTSSTAPAPVLAPAAAAAALAWNSRIALCVSPPPAHNIVPPQRFLYLSRACLGRTIINVKRGSNKRQFPHHPAARASNPPASSETGDQSPISLPRQGQLVALGRTPADALGVPVSREAQTAHCAAALYHISRHLPPRRSAIVDEREGGGVDELVRTGSVSAANTCSWEFDDDRHGWKPLAQEPQALVEAAHAAGETTVQVSFRAWTYV
jgi:hypothetical protein